MMLQPTPQQIELWENLEKCSDPETEKELYRQLDVLAKEQFEKAKKESPFNY